MVHPYIPAVLAIAEPLAESLDLEVVQAVFQTHTNPPTLRIDVRNRQDYTGLRDCEQMSRALEEALEQENTIPEAYVLEISSPGIPNHLQSDQDFLSFRGFPVAVQVEDPQQGSRSYRGSLLGRTETLVQINQKGKILSLPREQVTQVQLVDEGPE